MSLLIRLFFAGAALMFLIALWRINYLIVVVPAVIIAALFIVAIYQKLR